MFRILPSHSLAVSIRQAQQCGSSRDYVIIRSAGKSCPTISSISRSVLGRRAASSSVRRRGATRCGTARDPKSTLRFLAASNPSTRPMGSSSRQACPRFTSSAGERLSAEASIQARLDATERALASGAGRGRYGDRGPAVAQILSPATYAVIKDWQTLVAGLVGFGGLAWSPTKMQRWSGTRCARPPADRGQGKGDSRRESESLRRCRVLGNRLQPAGGGHSQEAAKNLLEETKSAGKARQFSKRFAISRARTFSTLPRYRA